MTSTIHLRRCFAERKVKGLPPLPGTSMPPAPSDASDSEGALLVNMLHECFPTVEKGVIRVRTTAP